jgi:hypothetical protein
MGSLYGFEIRSELPLRRLAALDGPRGVIHLRRASEPLAPVAGAVVHVAASGPAFKLTRTSRGLHVEVESAGEFLVEPPSVLLVGRNGGGDDLWEHRTLTTALPLLLAERGDLVMHAAAIEFRGQAFLLAGSPGRGKSTSALAAIRLGYPMLAEDGANVDLSGPDPLVWPGPLGLRLGAPKRTVFPPGTVHPHGPVPLAAVLVIGERGPDLSVTPVEPAAAIPLVLPHLVYGGSDRLAGAFSLCARLVERVPVRRVSFPDGVDALPAAVERLLSGAARDRG